MPSNIGKVSTTSRLPKQRDGTIMQSTGFDTKNKTTCTRPNSNSNKILTVPTNSKLKSSVTFLEPPNPPKPTTEAHNSESDRNNKNSHIRTKMTTIQEHIHLPHALHFNLVTKLGTEPSMAEKHNVDLDKPFETYTLYLIRHGEAAHNILEKAAKKEALESCIAEGLDPEAPQTKERVNAAREAVLNDETLFDARLSEQGCMEAQHAGRRLEEIIKLHHLPPPEHVLVSPLTRTLETANYVFPDSNDIHVREELRERQTGKPPDTRSPSESLMSRPSFQRFSMQTLRRQSLANLNKELESMEEFEDVEFDEEEPTSERRRRRPRTSSGCSDGSETEEDKHMLRDRTNKLLDLLAEAREQSVAVVTHKGYLRELERGPFGNPSAKEFNNCEIRVYQVRVHKDKSLDVAHRVV
jgi:broad specificity phosphatase PhoE